jgi:hypothetical protein
MGQRKSSLVCLRVRFAAPNNAWAASSVASADKQDFALHRNRGQLPFVLEEGWTVHRVENELFRVIVKTGLSATIIHSAAQTAESKKPPGSQGGSQANDTAVATSLAVTQWLLEIR